jgi:hypothetical protein
MLLLRNNTFTHIQLENHPSLSRWHGRYTCDHGLHHARFSRPPHSPPPPFLFRYVVLFFYPLDFTFVCPTEIAAYNDVAKQLFAMSAVRPQPRHSHRAICPRSH